MGLDLGGYDLKYSDEEFLLRLIDLVGIDSSEVSPVIESIQQEIQSIKTQFQPVLFVDTDFKRTTEPLFALSLSENHRYIDCAEQLINRPVHDQVTIAGQLAAKHYEANDGVADVWGQIQRYVFTYAEGQLVVFDTKGGVIGECDVVQPRKASVSLGRRQFNVA